MFTITALPASYGDSLWIEYGEPGNARHVLIDGGLAGTFDHVEAIVQSLAEPRSLELLVVSHVDEDHIAGAVRLLGSVRNVGLTLDDVWFNGREHLQGKQVILDRLGSKQGEFLGALISKQTTHWNSAFNGWPVEVPAHGTLPVRVLPGGMHLTLLSPGRAELEAMIPVWDRELADAGAGIDWTDIDAVLDLLRKQPRLRPRDTLGGSRQLESLLRAKFEPDHSEANGTSIALLAEYAGRSVLLGADAYAPVLTASIDRLLRERGLDRLPLSLFKVPHHGSAGNVNVELLERLDCSHYLISTNGKRYDHPDAEAVARIVRHGGKTPSIHFNYRSEFSGIWDDEALGQGIDYQAHYPFEGQEGCIIDVEALSP